MPVAIVRLFDLPASDIQLLISASRQENHRFVDRLVDEYADGSNRFALPGEALYAAYTDETIVGIGGLNRDPYVAQVDAGRVRHLYVLEEWRNRGIGRRLMEQIIDEARDHFSVLALRTFSLDAGRFYITIGFEAVSDDEAVTHRLLLG